MTVSASASVFSSPGVSYDIQHIEGWSAQVLTESAKVPFKDLGAVIVWGESAILSAEYGLDYLA